MEADPDPSDEEYRASSGAVGAFFAIIMGIALALQARADKLQAEAAAKCQAHPTPRCSTK